MEKGNIQRLLERIGKIFRILLFNGILLLFILLVFEYGLEKWNPALKGGSSLISRCVPLREAGLPNSAFSLKPNPSDLMISDNLVEKNYYIELDSNGFLSGKGNSPNPDVNIVFLGGSTTLCAFVDEAIKFPSLVGEFFQEKGLLVNTYNGGQASNHTLNSINILINKVIHADMQVAVMMHAVNDLSYMMYFGDYFSKDDNFHRKLISTAYIAEKTNHSFVDLNSDNLIFRVKKTSQALFPNIYGLLFELKQQAIGDPVELEFAGLKPKAPGEVQFDQFKRNLQTFVAICKANNILPVLMTQFNRITPAEMNTNPAFQYFKRKLATGNLTVEEYCGWYARLNQITRDVAAKEGAVLVDLDVEVPKSKEYMYDLVHLTNEGSKVAAQAIFRKLQPEVTRLPSK